MSLALCVRHAVLPAGDHGRDRHAGLLLRVHRHLQRARAGLLLLRHGVHQAVPGPGGPQRRAARAAVRPGGRAAHAAGESAAPWWSRRGGAGHFNNVFIARGHILGLILMIFMYCVFWSL